MRRLALALTGLLLLAPLPAHAADYHWRGGCAYRMTSVEVVVAGNHTGDRTQWAVVMSASLAFYDASSPATPVGATVRCVLLRNGEPEASTAPVHGYGLVTNVETSSYQGDLTDVLGICEDITFDDGQHVFQCAVSNEVQIPPQPIQDAIDGSARLVSGAAGDAACPVTGESAATRELAGAWVGDRSLVLGYGCG